MFFRLGAVRNTDLGNTCPFDFSAVYPFALIFGTFKSHSSSFFSYVVMEPITVCCLLTLSNTVMEAPSCLEYTSFLICNMGQKLIWQAPWYVRFLIGSFKSCFCNDRPTSCLFLPYPRPFTLCMQFKVHLRINLLYIGCIILVDEQLMCAMDNYR